MAEVADVDTWGGRTLMMAELRNDVMRRAEATPWMTAVRLGDQAATYGQLAESLVSYESVMDRHGMAPEAAIYAALIQRLPALAEISDPAKQGQMVDQVLAWLGRNLPSSGGTLRVAG
ncbi:MULTISPECIES: hypothetical protein [unclassified Gordonia (in: high G+C Gram-positive bacteria)]